MLGQIIEGLGDTCYIRSNRKGSCRCLLCQVQSQRLKETIVMLGPFQDTLLCQVQSLGTCYVRSICGDSCYVRLGPFLQRIVMLGLGRNFVIFGSDLLCLVIYRLSQVRLGYFTLGYFSSGYFRLGYFNLAYFSLGQVRLFQFRLVQVRLFQVSLFQFRLGYFSLGQFRLVQVSFGQVILGWVIFG